MRLILLFLLINNYSYANMNYRYYYKECNSALEAKVNGDIPKAILFYEKAFSKYRPFIDDLKNLYSCYKTINDSKNAYKTLERMVLIGFQPEEKSYLCTPSNPILERIDHTDFIADSLLKAKLNANYSNLRSKFMKKVNIAKHAYIQSIITNDRFIGYIRTKSDSSEESVIQDIGFNANSQLFLNLIINKKLDEDIPFDYYGDYFNIALLHIVLSVKNEEDQKILFDYLKGQVLKGNLHPSQYAVFYDAKYVRRLGHKYSFYGAFHYFDEDSNSIKILIDPKENIEDIDKRREEIFLPSLRLISKKNEL